MRFFTWLLVLSLSLASLSSVSEARKPKKKTVHRSAKAALPDPVTLASATGELTSFSFLSRGYGKKVGEVFTSINLRCKPNFFPLWDVRDDADPGFVVDYFACVPSSATVDYGVRTCSTTGCEAQMATSLMSSENQPLPIGAFKVAAFRRSENLLPRCLFIEEVKPELALPELPLELEEEVSRGPAHSPEGSISCLARCAQGLCGQTVLFSGVLEVQN